MRGLSSDGCNSVPWTGPPTAGRQAGVPHGPGGCRSEIEVRALPGLRTAAAHRSGMAEGELSLSLFS